MYANEAEVGQALARQRHRPRRGVPDYQDPSLGRGQSARRRATSRCSALGTDYLDLWLVHWPPPRRGDSRQLWNELLEIQADGLVRDVGVSNYSLTEIDDLTRTPGRRQR